MIDYKQAQSDMDFESTHHYLLAEQERLKKLLGAVTGSLLSIEELNSVSSESTKVSLREHLRFVNQAVARLQAGTYGICASCGGPISPNVLKTRPYTISCMGCSLSVG